MMVNIQISKTGLVRQYDTTKLHEAVVAYCFGRAGYDFVNDAHAEIVRKTWRGTDAEFIAAVNAKSVPMLDRLASGDVPPPRGITVDPRMVLIQPLIDAMAALPPAIRAAALANVNESTLAVMRTVAPELFAAESVGDVPPTPIIPAGEVAARRARNR